MKRELLLSLALWLGLLGGPALAQHPIWTIGTALPMPERTLRVSAFQPSAYALGHGIELAAHPLAFPVLPHASLKKNWRNKDIFLASRHALFFPTLALRMALNDGFPDLMPDTSFTQADVPAVLGITNEFLASTWLRKGTNCAPPNHLLTLKLGLQLGTPKDTMSPLLERPFLFPRTAINQGQPLWYVGLDLDGNLNTYLNYAIDLEFLSVGWKPGFWAIEHKALLVWPIGLSSTIALGYKVSYGTYPTRQQNFGVFPLVDFIWHTRFKAKRRAGEVG